MHLIDVGSFCTDGSISMYLSPLEHHAADRGFPCTSPRAGRMPQHVDASYWTPEETKALIELRNQMTSTRSLRWQDVARIMKRTVSSVRNKSLRRAHNADCEARKANRCRQCFALKRNHDYPMRLSYCKVHVKMNLTSDHLVFSDHLAFRAPAAALVPRAPPVTSLPFTLRDSESLQLMRTYLHSFKLQDESMFTRANDLALDLTDRATTERARALEELANSI